MKPSKTVLEGLQDLDQISTLGDLRRVVGNSLLALARKEISATDVEAMGKGLDAISNSLNAEIKVARVKLDLRQTGGQMGEIVHLGQTLIGNAPQAAAA
jgi:hypothetical protein